METNVEQIENNSSYCTIFSFVVRNICFILSELTSYDTPQWDVVNPNTEHWGRIRKKQKTSL